MIFLRFSIKVSRIPKISDSLFLPFTEAPLAALFKKFSSFTGKGKSLFPEVNSIIFLKKPPIPFAPCAKSSISKPLFLIKSKESWAIFLEFSLSSLISFLMLFLVFS